MGWLNEPSNLGLYILLICIAFSVNGNVKNTNSKSNVQDGMAQLHVAVTAGSILFTVIYFCGCRVDSIYHKMCLSLKMAHITGLPVQIFIITSRSHISLCIVLFNELIQYYHLPLNLAKPAT